MKPEDIIQEVIKELQERLDGTPVFVSIDTNETPPQVRFMIPGCRTFTSRNLTDFIPAGKEMMCRNLLVDLVRMRMLELETFDEEQFEDDYLEHPMSVFEQFVVDDIRDILDRFVEEIEPHMPPLSAANVCFEGEDPHIHIEVQTDQGPSMTVLEVYFDTKLKEWYTIKDITVGDFEAEAKVVVSSKEEMLDLLSGTFEELIEQQEKEDDEHFVMMTHLLHLPDFTWQTKAVMCLQFICRRHGFLTDEEIHEIVLDSTKGSTNPVRKAFMETEKFLHGDFSKMLDISCNKVHIMPVEVLYEEMEEALRDNNLSWRAKGLYMFLLTHEEEPELGDLQKVCKDKSETILKALKELSDNDYTEPFAS